MRHPLLRGLLCALLLLSLVTPVLADDWCYRDGFRFRVPPGFSPHNEAEVKHGIGIARGMFGSVADADACSYVRDLGGPAEAQIGAMAIELKGPLKGLLDATGLDAFEAQMNAAMEQLPEGYAEGSVRRLDVGAGTPALEIAAVHEDMFGEPQVQRAVYAVGKDALAFLMFQGPVATREADDALWRGLVASFRLEGPWSLRRLLMRYGPFALGGLVLVLALVLARRVSRGPRNKLTWDHGLGTPNSSGAETGAEAGANPGLSRPMDGLPLYDDTGSPRSRPHAPAAAGSDLRHPVTAAPGPAGPVRRVLKAPVLQRAAVGTTGSAVPDPFARPLRSAVATPPPGAVPAVRAAPALRRPVPAAGGTPAARPHTLRAPLGSAQGAGTSRPPTGLASPGGAHRGPGGGVPSALLRPPTVRGPVAMGPSVPSDDLPTNVAQRGPMHQHAPDVSPTEPASMPDLFANLFGGPSGKEGTAVGQEPGRVTPGGSRIRPGNAVPER